jgi:sugar transferase (PEP-CTERM/EpsH1 system associated)
MDKPSQKNMSSPPLIVHVIHHLRMGGLENGVVNLINRIPADRYRHCVMCIEDFAEFRNRITRTDVEVLALRRSALSRTGLYRLIHAELAARRPSIVHSRNLSGLDALLPAVAARVPCRIHSEHGWAVQDLKGTNLRPRLLRRLHSPLVHRYVTVSKHLERYLTSSVGIAASRIAQIYNGVDTARFAPVDEKPADVMPAHFHGADKVVVGTVGRLEDVKDQATFIRAVGRLVRESPGMRDRLRFAVVGEGVLRASLEALAHDEGVGDILWLPGARDDVDRVYQCLDVFVLPSLNEGISNTLLEAMASGLPVVATNVGGNAELVQDGVQGRLIPVSDPPALAAALGVYIQDKAMRLRHGRAGRERALATFSIEAMVESYLRLYDAQIAIRRGSAKWLN